nr:hypothetical protein [Tanacetum cinerariifolium]
MYLFSSIANVHRTITRRGEDTSQPPPPPIASPEAPQMVSSVKLPILKKGEYIFWTMKMEQYLAHTDYALWEVILNDICKNKRKKAKSTLFMAIPDEHIARFHGIKDANTLWAAIKTRFGGNAKSKKMQKNVFQLNMQIKKFLRSLPSAWSNISLIIRNKPDINNLDIDDLYNNLKVYEANIKGSSRSSSNLQNMAFVFAESTNNTNELNTAYSVFTATGHSYQAQGSSSYVVELMFLFFANQPSILQLDDEDLEKIDQDDLEEMDLKWQVECFNCHRRWHFARDCISARNSGNRSRDAGNAGYKGRYNDKSYQVEEEATDFDLMAFTSNPSSSSSSNHELDEALREKEDLKAKLKKFETFKNLTKLLDSQISAKVKTGLGYDSPFNEKEVLDIKEEEVTETVFDNRSNDEENSLANDRFKKSKGYHAVPPPLTRNYMPPKSDVSFAGLDDFIYKFKMSETVSSLIKDEKDAPETSTACVENSKEDMDLDEFCRMKDIKREYSNARTLQQKEVAKRKNMTLIEAARTMLIDSLLPITFWAEAVNTTCYVLNRALVTKTHNKTPYELLNGRTPRLDFMRPFGCLVTILNTLDPLGKFKGKADERFLVGYSVTISVGNQTDKNAGPQDTTGNAGTQDNVDAGKEVSDQQYIVLPLWSSISSTFKSSDDKAEDDKTKDDTGSKTVKEPVNQEDQAYKDELDRLISPEKEASDVTDALRKDNPVNAASTSGTFSAGRPTSPHPDAFIPSNTLLHVDQDDSQIPDLEDTAKLQSTGIFNSAYDDDLDIFTSLVQSVGAEAEFNNMESSTVVSLIPTYRVHLDHPKDQILGDPKSTVQTRGMAKKSSGAHAFVSYIHKQRRTNHKDYKNYLFACFLSQMKPKKVSQALDDESWVEAMQEELLQFSLQKVWRLVDLPYGKKAIETKWVYRNKKDEKGIVVWNKARLVAQGHRQEEGIDYGEVFAPVARIEAIRIFLAFASFMGFIVYQIEVKQSDEGIFISQDKYVVEILKKFDFSSIKTTSTPIETQKPLVKDEEAAAVDVYLYRSMIGSLMYLTTSRPNIMFAICAYSRFQVTPKLSHLHVVKWIFRYLKGQPKLGLWYPRDSLFDLEAYSDSDYAGANLDRKSITGGCQFLGRRLTSWQCKKQTIVATSITEAEYVAAANYCG